MLFRPLAKHGILIEQFHTEVMEKIDLSYKMLWEKPYSPIFSSLTGYIDLKVTTQTGAELLQKVVAVVEV